ncbi:penicillin-binding protein 1C [Paludibacter sp. 221]|uniref:penicillin-binding protein 1C n=1 Tax=Paludibacter sp. 221 TaxID=2302939 RepID=UPI0013D440F3|nr:penicillin-binding protein 1C [Paludibacter sp. 221]NDV47526.1 penicillin-binding protein 1C [Paludibacter sp. 221]
MGVVAILLVLYIFSLPRVLFDVPYSTVVTDRNGELLGARIADDEQWRFPMSDTVPAKFEMCLTEFEDRWFRRHWGVNPLAVGRALVQNVKERRVVSGGSTITMQVIRLSRNKPRTLWEKMIEAILATRLECRYTKDEILALYTAHAPFGGNVVGLDAASWRYFGRRADRLSWGESATLAVLPNAPAIVHLSKNREALLDKRNRLLARLFEKGVIDRTTYELALSEGLPQEPYPLPQVAPHLVARIHASRKGEHCVSALDKNIQVHIEELLERRNADFSRSGINNMAAVVMDVRTNEVIAYCGNVNFGEDKWGNQVDVLQAERSTGSILKPFLYEAMLHEGEILPRTLIPDVPVNINGFSPQNFNLGYEGAVPAADAVARSLNIPLVYMLRQFGVPKFYDYLKQNEVADLPRAASHYGLSLILGGAEAELIEIANAYSNMARTLLGLESSHYKLLIKEEARRISTTFDAGAVWQVFDAIKEVNRPEEIDWRSISTMQTIAWKTGTSYGFRDAWAVGVTPRYVVGVWVGNASGEGKPNLTGARTAGPVMFDIFDFLPSSAWFQSPSGKFIEAEVCRRSGQLKGRFCDDVDTVLLLPAALRTDACPYHVRVNLTYNERFRVYEHCLGEESVVSKSWFVLPPAWAWYYKQHNPGYKALPPFKAGCGADVYNPMQFIYPAGNTTVHLTKQLDGTAGAVTFELAHSKPNATVFWHIDNEYVASTTDFHKLTVSPQKGNRSITVVDNEGNTLSVSVEVK